MTFVAASQVHIGDHSEGCIAQSVGWHGDLVEIEWVDDEGGRAVLRYKPDTPVKVTPWERDISPVEHRPWCRKHLADLFPNYGSDCTCGVEARDIPPDGERG